MCTGWGSKHIFSSTLGPQVSGGATGHSIVAKCQGGRWGAGIFKLISCAPTTEESVEDTTTESVSNDKPTRPTVFVAYPYDRRDKWIGECIRPLLSLYGCNARFGANLFGDIGNEVAKAIAASNLLIAFLTRTDKLADGQWVTSEWVHQEIGFARGKGIPVVVIRELGVFTKMGLLGDIQFIELDSDREAFAAMATLRMAVRKLLFDESDDDGLAVCHLAKLGRKDYWNTQWWDFWLWISGSEEQLDSIASVDYILGDDFEPSVEPGAARRFFGSYNETEEEVTVTAKVRFKSGQWKKVRHRVSLSGAAATPI